MSWSVFGTCFYVEQFQSDWHHKDINVVLNKIPEEEGMGVMSGDVAGVESIS
jgi:hypothetical protein